MAESQESGDATPNHLVIAQLSKTRLCIKFSKGACKDSECRFAHSREELRDQPDLSKTAICRAFARGKCTDTDCKYAHGETELRGSPTVYKTQLCNFHARGHCKKGDKCRHAHGRKEQRAFPGQIPALSPNKESPKGTPNRGARQTQLQASPASPYKPSDDVSKNLVSAFDQAFQTPQKSQKPTAAQEDCPSGPAEPMKVLLPEAPVASPPYYPELDVRGLLLPQSSGLPSPWQLQTPPDMAWTAAAAAAMSAHQHHMAANAAASAALQWSLMQQSCVSPVPGLPTHSQSISELTWSGKEPAESTPANDDRRWVL